MRQLKWAIATAVILAVPMTANAGFVLEGSLGKGYVVSPDLASGFGDTQIMIAPGYGLGEMLRLELGFNFPLGDVGSFDLQLRPMIVLDPPLLPIYVRGVVAVSNLIAEGDINYAIGGAGGVSFSLAGIGIFGEVGVIPFFAGDVTVWTIEGRIGVYYAM